MPNLPYLLFCPVVTGRWGKCSDSVANVGIMASNLFCIERHIPNNHLEKTIRTK